MCGPPWGMATCSATMTAGAPGGADHGPRSTSWAADANGAGRKYTRIAPVRSLMNTVPDGLDDSPNTAAGGKLVLVASTTPTCDMHFPSGLLSARRRLLCPEVRPPCREVVVMKFRVRALMQRPTPGWSGLTAR